MMLAGSFLGGAKNRLLPVSIPFWFFAAAAVFHMAAWALLFLGADDVAGFVAGTGIVLAALHLLTLGVLAMVAIGASFQLLPVATGQPLIRTWPARLCFWLLTPGTMLLAFGMASGNRTALYAGSAAVASALLVFAVLTAFNLRRASSMPVVAAHGWGALVALIGFAGLGLALVVDFDLGFLVDHQGIAGLHMLLATFGFMGLLVLGLSQILIPMFALSRTLPAWIGWGQLGLALTALSLASLAVWSDSTALGVAAGLGAFAAAGVYLWGMFTALKTGMRKRLGISFVLIRSSWVLAVLGLFLGLATLLDMPIPNLPALFGFVILVGWLLTFLLGILQRIAPFLASMHAVGANGRPALLSDLTPELPARLSAGLHGLAVLAVALGIILDSGLVVKIGAAVGFTGSLAFAAFIFGVIHRLAPSAPKA